MLICFGRGLDSTYRICELSREEITIHPYYVNDKRKSFDNEIAAMNQIRTLLEKHPLSKFNLLPITIVDMDTISENTLISSLYEKMREKYSLGTQYHYLAQLASQIDVDFELGATFDPRGKIARTILGEGAKINETSEGKIKNLDYLDIDFTNASHDLKNIFGRFRMPLSLFHKTKQSEYKGLCDMGLKEVADSTWFCHQPVLGFPCGHCNPCWDAMNEGMSWRVPHIGRFLGLLRAVPAILRTKIQGW